MVIALDVRSLNSGIRGGIPEFTKMLCQYLITHAPHHTYILFGNGAMLHPDSVNSLHVWSLYPYVRMCITRYPTKLFNALLILFHWPSIERLIFSQTGLRADIFIACNFDFFSFSSDIKKYIITHDLTFDLYPSFSSWRKSLKYKIIRPKKNLHSFSHCIVNSLQTKRDIQHYYQYPTDRIIHIPFGVDDSFFENAIDQEGDVLSEKKFCSLKRPFIFFLGAEEPRKNVSLLFDAFALLVKNRSSYKAFTLCISGREAAKKDIFQMAKARGVDSNVYWAGELTHKERRFLFAKAACFVYPSFYEGFGFPPLEAAACGTPVIAAINSSIGEVMENSCITIDSYNSSSLMCALKTVFECPEFIKKLCELGKIQAQKYSFSKTGAAILKYIEEGYEN